MRPSWGVLGLAFLGISFYPLLFPLHSVHPAGIKLLAEDLNLSNADRLTRVDLFQSGSLPLHSVYVRVAFLLSKLSEPWPMRSFLELDQRTVPGPCLPSL